MEVRVLNDGERHRLEALERQMGLEEPGLAAALRHRDASANGAMGWRAIALLVFAPFVFALLIVAFGVLATIITVVAVFAIAAASRRRQHNRGRGG
ncbi:DUF3040 domain-containing protein [Pseudonocardia sp.]|uniref:DUF3040 domain-containing protein n=1 Tax=Pseudonocardia sp. TaxID=60912 RepID=UPI002D96B6C6|nr:DUF3040 domain-containing protein [Pseudonocardia sp.]